MAGREQDKQLLPGSMLPISQPVQHTHTHTVYYCILHTLLLTHTHTRTHTAVLVCVLVCVFSPVGGRSGGGLLCLSRPRGGRRTFTPLRVYVCVYVCDVDG